MKILSRIMPVLLGGAIILALSGCNIAGLGSSGSSPNTSAPATPGGLAVSGNASTALTVSWTAVSGATGYDLFRSTSATGTYTSVETGSGTSYSDTGLSVDTTYYYEVEATDSAGSSAKSGDVSGSTLPYMTLDMGSYTSGSAGDIAIDSSGTIYIDGDLSTSSTTSVPVYWKGGTLTSLSMGSNSYGVANQMSVSSNGVFIAGGVGSKSSTVQPAYWDNGTLTQLKLSSTTYTSGQALGIVNTGTSGDTYVVGDETYSSGSSTISIPVYWDINNTGTQAQDLMPSSGYVAGIAALAVNDNGTIYIAGTLFNSSGTATPSAWKINSSGASYVTLPASSSANDLAVDGVVETNGDAIIDGWANASGPTSGEYWTITSSTTTAPNPVALSSGTSGAADVYPLGMAQDSSGAVYIAGYTQATSSSTSSQSPIYWYNFGSPQTLPTGTGNSYSQAGGVATSGTNFYVAGAVGTSSSSQIPVYWPNGK